MKLGTFISIKRRNAFAKVLKAQGIAIRKYTINNQILHPEYVTDAKEEGIKYEVGFGNVDYKRQWKSLYCVEEIK